MPKTIKTLKKTTEEILLKNGLDEARLETKIILSQIIGVKENELILHNDKTLSFFQIRKLNKFIKFRLKGMPIYKIIGKCKFYGLDFFTTKNVLDPRPETEILVEQVLKQINGFNWKNTKKINILELGTGSGCILLSLLKNIKNSVGIGIDISKKALRIAKKNSKNLELNNKVIFQNSSWKNLNNPIFQIVNKFDFIVSNPPYIKSEDIKTLQKEVREFDPMFALDGGESGLECYQDIAILINSKNLLNSDGRIFLEIGQNQEKEVIKIFKEQGFKIKNQYKDFSDIIRILEFSH